MSGCINTPSNNKFYSSPFISWLKFRPVTFVIISITHSYVLRYFYNEFLDNVTVLDEEH